MPPGIVFETKWQQMLGLMDRMLGLGLERLPFVGDAGYGDVAEFRRQLTARQRLYLLEVMSTTAVWAPGTGPQPSEGPMGKTGRPRTQYHDGEHLPLSVTELALSQTEEALLQVRWKNGDGPQRKGRFAALRLQPANGHYQGLAPEPEQRRQHGNGPRGRSCRSTTGSAPCRRTRRWSVWWIWPSCAGVWSATTRK